ncbi:MAG: DegV family protein [Chloroflexi bacterium]|nr:DegV family protein [Chloroflexota bacterium]
MGVRIVTDTSCDLSPELDREVKALGTKVIPFFFHFGMDPYADKAMSMREFFDRANREWPTTAAPSSGAFGEAFREIIEGGDEVVCITITSRHSATYNAAVLASRDFAPGQVSVVDSLSLSFGQGILVMMAARAAHAGATKEQILEMLDDIKQRLHVLIALDTVNYLVKGGRASRLTGALATLLKLRPILTLRDGELTVIDKPRGRETSKDRLLKLAHELFPAQVVGVMHIAAEAEALEMADRLAAQTGYPREEIILGETGMALAAHGGPGTLGIIVVSR